MTSGIGATVLGWPRIGPRRERKFAVEAYWAGRIDREKLVATAAELRLAAWKELSAAGLDSVPSHTFSFYDQVLDTAMLVGAVPQRYRRDNDLDTYFAAARGTDDLPPLEMTKWFDTNYHYLVPEIGPQTRFALSGEQPLAEYREALAAGSAEGVAGVAALSEKTLLAGVVDGRNIWRTDLRHAAAAAAEVLPTTSCSLLHVPYDLDDETEMEPGVRSRLAFARQKVTEVVALAKALREGVPQAWGREPSSTPRRDDQVRARLAALTPEDRKRAPYAQRAAVQETELALPPVGQPRLRPQDPHVRRGGANTAGHGRRGPSRSSLTGARGTTHRVTTAIRDPHRLPARVQPSLGLCDRCRCRWCRSGRCGWRCVTGGWVCPCSWEPIRPVADSMCVPSPGRARPPA